MNKEFLFWLVLNVAYTTYFGYIAWVLYKEKRYDKDQM